MHCRCGCDLADHYAKRGKRPCRRCECRDFEGDPRSLQGPQAPPPVVIACRLPQIISPE